MEGEDLVGSVLDAQFRIESLIGKGRVGGFVYRALDTKSGEPVAVRTLAQLSPGFIDEAGALRKLSDSTADAERLVAYGSVGDTPWLVFEWLEGQSLEMHLAEGGGGARSIGEAITILEPAARALAAAHALGIVHGDVRPANMWLARSGDRTRVKLTQFVVGGAPSFAPTHAAPEHFKPSYGSIGPATDVFGLALSFVEVVSGRRAFDAVDETELYLATSDIKKRPTLRARGVATSDAIEAVLQSALAVDPKRRHPDAKAFWDALLAAMPELTPAASSVRPGAQGPLVVDAPKDADRSAMFAWIAVAFVAAAAAAVVATKMNARPSPPPPAPSPSTTPIAPPPAPPPPPKPEEPAAPAVKVKPFLTDMVRVPEGIFTMGTDRDGKGDGPSHRVRLTKAFTIDRLEVTAEAYQACIDEGRCTKRGGTEIGCSDAATQPKHPANCVDRLQAEQYCAFAGKRLPTEAEWEYAARGDDEREWPWGNVAPTTCAMAVVSSVTGECADRKGPLAVGSAGEGKGPFGTLDMAGNVWEWVADGYEPYAAKEIVDPKATPNPNPGAKGIVRGGSWDYAPTSAKTTYRLPWPANAANVSIGFRCAQDALD